MELKNLLCCVGFTPNSSNKVSKYLKYEGIKPLLNPFSKLSNVNDDFHRRNVTIDNRLLYHKMIDCSNHHFRALMLNVGVFENHWRLLEILYHYFPNLLIWDQVLKELKDNFHKGVKNEILGKHKVAAFTYEILDNIFDYVHDKIERTFKFTWNSMSNNYSWSSTYGLFKRIVTFFPKQLCTCNDYINYDESFLKELSVLYRVKDNIKDILNNIPIDYQEGNHMNIYTHDVIKALTPQIPKPDIMKKSTKLPYDLLPQILRLDFIQSVVKDKTRSNITFDIKEEKYMAFRKVNKCFVCDNDLTETIYNTHIKDSNICEQVSIYKSDTIYPIIHRCLRCRKDKYGKPFKSNDKCIMARHYKWMTFYSLYQNMDLPKDVLWLIIMKYTHIRCI